jgi:hypothetical protein
MTSEGFGEMFEGDYADTCARTFTAHRLCTLIINKENFTNLFSLLPIIEFIPD